MARNPRRSLGTSGAVELTEKQKEVVTLSQEGLTIEQAAKRMNIAESGVYNHVRKLKAKGVAVEFLKASQAAEAAPTNGGGTSADAELTEVARRALGNDADQYVNALQQVIDECGARKAEIGETIGTLQNEDAALSLRIEKLAARLAEAKRVVEQIGALA